jgi:hypothetical protein
MKFISRHNYFFDINISWINNIANIYTWFNNIHIKNIIHIHSNLISKNLWWRTNVYIKKFIHPYVSVHSMSFLVTNSKACDSMFAQCIGYALLKLLKWFFFIKLNCISCLLLCEMVTFEDMFNIKKTGEILTNYFL